MIHTYSQRMTPPYSGQLQVADAEHARALTLDGRNWEIQVVRWAETNVFGHERRNGQQVLRNYARVAMIKDGELQRLGGRASILEQGSIDDYVTELAEYVGTAELPFAPADKYELWLLDPDDDAPLALVHTCRREDEMASFPASPDWTALPASAMPIEQTEDEQQVYVPPVNYRLERLVAERAGQRPKARWFNRERTDRDDFPACLVREDWSTPADADLYRRYIERQAPRLLMLHRLDTAVRARLEIAARAHAGEVEYYHLLYPEVADPEVLASIRVQARLRQSSEVRRGFAWSGEGH